MYNVLSNDRLYSFQRIINTRVITFKVLKYEEDFKGVRIVFFQKNF